MHNSALAGKIDQGFNVEFLEPRVLLSGTHYVVDSLSSSTGVNGRLTIFEAIEAANTNQAVGDAPAGSSDEVDRITFDPSLSGEEFELRGMPLEVLDSLVIQGLGSDQLSINGGMGSRVFQVSGEDVAVTISGLTIKNGYTHEGGAGLYNNGSSIELFDVVVMDNESDSYGGSFSPGGGICNINGRITLTDSVLTSNRCDDTGEAVYNENGEFIATNVTFASVGYILNGRSGGIINQSGDVVLTDCRLDNFRGGSIHNDDGSLSITRTTISSCSGGAAISSLGGEIALTDSSVLKSESGGIVTENTTATLTNSIIMGSGYWGDAIYHYSGQMTLVNSVVACNQGDGIINEGTLVLIQSTVAFNAGDGIETREPFGVTTIHNSLVAHNTEEDINGTFTGFNSLVAVDPDFVGLPFTGADEQWGTDDDEYGDLRLNGTSLAIDRGDIQYALDIDGLVLTTDIGGNTRNVGESVDVGAYEFQGDMSPLREQPSSQVTTLEDIVDSTDGEISLREALLYAPESGQEVTFTEALSGGVILLGDECLYICQPVIINAASVGGMTITANAAEHLMVVAAGDGDVGINGLTLSGMESRFTIYDGGAILNSGRLIMHQSIIAGNHNGGIINYGGWLWMENSTIFNNHSMKYGGGLYNISGTAVLINTIVSGNHSELGGGIHNEAGYVSIYESTISGNRVLGGKGGGVYNTGTLVVERTNLIRNTANFGGGIYNEKESIATIWYSNIYGNIARDQGAGLYNMGLVDLNHSVFFGNQSKDLYSGAIVTDDGEIILTHCTVTGNTAPEYGMGGGIFNSSSRVILNNSIVALNNAYKDPDISGSYINQNSLVGIDPKFVGNPDHGGDGWGDNPNTHAIDESANDDYGGLQLADTSPAINMGDNTLVRDGEGNILSHDLAGQTRFIDGQVDIGAYEYQSQISNFRETLSAEVTTTADVFDTTDGKTSLREAIVYAGLLRQDVTFAQDLTRRKFTLDGKQLVIDQSVNIQAADIGGITIDADDRSRVLLVANPVAEVTLEGVTITDGFVYDYGGGICNYGHLVLRDSAVTNNTAEKSSQARGGGIYNHSGSVTLFNSTISGNSSYYYAGGIYNFNGLLNIYHSQILNNTAVNHSGGGIYNTNESIMDMADSVVSGNQCYSKGGGIYINDSVATIFDSQVLNNSAGDGGGAYSSYSGLTILDATVSGNTANYAAGISNNNDSILVINNSQVTSNHADKSTGGIANYSDGTLASISNSIISDNSSDRNCGGIYNSGILILTNTAITDNTAKEDGGGLTNGGQAIVTSATISGNAAENGGGIWFYCYSTYHYNDLFLINTKVYGNRADRNGGGVYVSDDDSSFYSINSIISSNWARDDGGAIHSDGNLWLTHTTVAANTAKGTGGGIYSTGYVNLKNSILALNTARYDPDTNDQIFGSNNLIGIDPLFILNPYSGSNGWGDNPATGANEASNDNYGDLRLRDDSPAINAGDHSLLPVDEYDLDRDLDMDELLPIDLDGNLRISGDTVDIGAYESASTFSAYKGDFNGDGVMTQADLDVLEHNWGKDGQVSLTDGDANADGIIDLFDLAILGQSWGDGVMWYEPDPNNSNSSGGSSGSGSFVGTVGLFDLDALGQNWGTYGAYSLAGDPDNLFANVGDLLDFGDEPVALF